MPLWKFDQMLKSCPGIQVRPPGVIRMEVPRASRELRDWVEHLMQSSLPCYIVCWEDALLRIVYQYDIVLVRAQCA